MHPNGTNDGSLQWVVREWVSTYAGPVTVAGQLAKYDTSNPNGTGIYGMIYWMTPICTRFQTIRSVLGPSAQVAGPSFTHYDHQGIQAFLDYCLANGCEVNALTWHDENDATSIASLPFRCSRCVDVLRTESGVRSAQNQPRRRERNCRADIRPPTGRHAGVLRRIGK